MVITTYIVDLHTTHNVRLTDQKTLVESDPIQCIYLILNYLKIKIVFGRTLKVAGCVKVSRSGTRGESQGTYTPSQKGK